MSEVKFTIKAGDYIDSREFTREECERFCELAVECGFDFVDGNGAHSKFESGFEYPHLTHIGVGLLTIKPQLWWEKNQYWTDTEGSNITTQFREFLDKEKGVKKFTKYDLKDGMRLEWRDGREFYVCGDVMLSKFKESNGLHHYDGNLINLNGFQQHDIMRVTDRDGTVLFNREEEPRELTIEEIAKAFNLPPERIRIKK